PSTVRRSATFLLNPSPPPYIYPLSLHDALPISQFGVGDHLLQAFINRLIAVLDHQPVNTAVDELNRGGKGGRHHRQAGAHRFDQDRKSTRLNSSHVKISYAVFCLKKKKISANLT